jgi:hypothetical protein
VNVTATGVDMVVDHIAIHSLGVNANSAFESASLCQQRPHNIGDGKVHTVKVYIVLKKRKEEKERIRFED